MFLARAPQGCRRRPATRVALRALVGLVAVLLGLSSLGQLAHLLLVPHAVCAEHGELLELDEQERHTALHTVASAEDSEHAPGELTAEHEHCQLLARGQREQAEPTPLTVVVSPAAGVGAALPAPHLAAVYEAIAALSLAPKTSPPRATVG